MLSAYGVRKNIRRNLICAVKEASKDAGEQNVAGDQHITPKKEKKESQLISAFKKARADGNEGLGWPDIELVHKVPAVQGGTQVVKTIFKKGAQLGDQQNLQQSNAL